MKQIRNTKIFINLHELLFFKVLSLFDKFRVLSKKVQWEELINNLTSLLKPLDGKMSCACIFTPFYFHLTFLFYYLIIVILLFSITHKNKLFTYFTHTKITLHALFQYIQTPGHH